MRDAEPKKEKKKEEKINKSVIQRDGRLCRAKICKGTLSIDWYRD